ncbi:hypothetical protein [Pseudoalteromonas luteoviolacea]|uniref:Lipoprotein n=1 Tax=Pseudoalteromonas luteoviolacea NCIMB 1942 TaxID=1365253 RepID=A0A162A9X1_9GAMM|nr:hypothetical protein [Pseudoalteromonas luteoviolacea]KZN46453.1 hypothetical protein N482_12390 [Pseudoalteromonas luteoviolacea NCIMB 1942]
MRYFSTFAVVFLVSFLVACSDRDISIHEVSEKSERSVKTKNCTQAMPCVFHDNIEFWVEIDKPQPETSFKVFFTSRRPIDISNAHLEGISMYMGKIPLMFVEQGDGRWQSEVIVGSCNLSEMEWKLVLYDSNKDKLELSPSVYTYQ